MQLKFSQAVIQVTIKTCLRTGSSLSKLDFYNLISYFFIIFIIYSFTCLFTFYLSTILLQLSLERETGIINGDFSDDVLFLRQLVLDGQWDNALDFVEPLRELPDFDLRTFRYYITKYKYFELLCIKQEPGPMHDNDFTVEVTDLLIFRLNCLLDKQISKWTKKYAC